MASYYARIISNHKKSYWPRMVGKLDQYANLFIQTCRLIFVCLCKQVTKLLILMRNAPPPLRPFLFNLPWNINSESELREWSRDLHDVAWSCHRTQFLRLVHSISMPRCTESFFTDSLSCFLNVSLHLPAYNDKLLSAEEYPRSGITTVVMGWPPGPKNGDYKGNTRNAGVIV